MSSIIYQAIAVIFALSIHELAHGLVSYWMGDPTAKLSGRLSLNPLAHIDWAGLICLLICGFGWAKPVPVDSRYYKDMKTGLIWTSFAGPLANFILSFIALFIYYALLKFVPMFAVGSIGIHILNILQYTAVISCGFGIFNLIPIPPLDGSKIIFSFLPDDKYYRFIEGTPWMSFLFMVLLIGGIIDTPMFLARQSVLNVMINVCQMIFGF